MPSRQSIDVRRQIDALPRYLLLLQPPDGWTQETGRSREPVLHEAVKLADVLALWDEDAE